MAQVTGYVCDVCKNYTEDKSRWLHLTANASAPGDKGWDICSNKCLVNLARERMEASGEASGRKSFTDEQKLEVVLYAEEHGYKAAGERFGIHPVTVGTWVRKFRSNEM